jgi:hypothetical protein
MKNTSFQPAESFDTNTGRICSRSRPFSTNRLNPERFVLLKYYYICFGVFTQVLTFQIINSRLFRIPCGENLQQQACSEVS